MTCQHCQTWILDDDHRCHRCGRRVRNSPARISPATFPIAGTATARAYDFTPAIDEEELPVRVRETNATSAAQQVLFSTPVADRRVIPFDSLTNPGGRERISQRSSAAEQPSASAPTVAEGHKVRPKRNESRNQSRLEFENLQGSSRGAEGRMPCDAPVAPMVSRVEAALLDTLLIALGCGLAAAIFFIVGSSFSIDRHVLPFVIAAVLTVPLSYKLIWAFADRESAGMLAIGLELVDFDGRRPSRTKRYVRLLGSIVSLLTAGFGMMWALIDEEKLTWHDHISSTFPTISSDK